MAFACDIPAVPTLQRDDDDLRITRYDFAPGAVTGWHLHGWPYFVIMLTEGVRCACTMAARSAQTHLVAGQAYNQPVRASSMT